MSIGHAFEGIRNDAKESCLSPFAVDVREKLLLRSSDALVFSLALAPPFSLGYRQLRGNAREGRDRAGLPNARRWDGSINQRSSPRGRTDRLRQALRYESLPPTAIRSTEFGARPVTIRPHKHVNCFFFQ